MVVSTLSCALTLSQAGCISDILRSLLLLFRERPCKLEKLLVVSDNSKQVK